MNHPDIHILADQEELFGVATEEFLPLAIQGVSTRGHLRVYKDPEAGLAFLEPMAHHLSDYGVGSLAEIFDGDPPFTPRGCIAQAWSVSEALLGWRRSRDIPPPLILNPPEHLARIPRDRQFP